MLEYKINNVEETLAHQEQQIDALSKTVAEQWENIDTIKKNMKLMKEKIDTLEGTGAGSVSKGENLSPIEQSTIDKPPHY